MKLGKLLIIITAFAISMGFLESAVVVYLREVLYPDGFAFPLSPIPVHLAFTELLREVATLIMMLAVGFLAAKRFSTGLAWFIYTFAIWDIFYYVFLKLLLGWPPSLMTWDVLFLIPTTWTGPVLAPVLVSLTMILLAMVVLVHAEKGKETRFTWQEWSGLILGSLILILGFIDDYTQYMLDHFSLPEMLQVKNPGVLKVATGYIPRRFPWWIFGTGAVVILGTTGIYRKRIRRI